MALRSISPAEPGARCSPVGWLDTAGNLRWIRVDPEEARQLGWQPVYTLPPHQPVGELSDERIREIAQAATLETNYSHNPYVQRACEAAIRAALSERPGAGDAKRVDRGEAVNLAHAIVSGDDKPTERGIQMLAEAVLRMDAALSGDNHE